MLIKAKNGGQVLLIPQNAIHPNRNQPRKRFDSDELEGLAESIRQNGIIQPITVRSLGNAQYELVTGERRLRAARIVGLTRIPSIVLDLSDEKSAVFALIENLQRQNLGFFEEAEALQQAMILYGIPQDVLAARLGKAPSTISNKLRLLRIPEDLRYEILKAHLTERHARALLKFESKAQISRALSIIIDRHLNVTETDKLIEQMLQSGFTPKKPPIKLFKDVRLFVNTLNHAVDTMRRSGIAADAVKSETEEYIEYVVRIPKEGGYVIRTKKPGVPATSCSDLKQVRQVEINP